MKGMYAYRHFLCHGQYGLDPMSIYNVLEMHKVQNPCVHEQKPGNQNFRLQTIGKKKNLPYDNGIFPWSSGVVREWPFWYPPKNYYYLHLTPFNRSPTSMLTAMFLIFIFI